jgi:hypothetical protein
MFATVLAVLAMGVILPQGFTWVATVPNCDGDAKTCLEKFSEKDAAKAASAVEGWSLKLLILATFLNLGIVYFPKRRKDPNP